jgi:hypothetical protein
VSKNPASQFYWSDWFRETGLRKGNFSHRGYWIDMLHHMHFAEKRRGILCGTREEIARLMGCSRRTSDRLLAYLVTEGVCDFEESEGIVTITNRRMVREAEIGQIRAEAGSKGGSKTQAKLKQTFKQKGRSPSPTPKAPTPKEEKKTPFIPLPDSLKGALDKAHTLNPRPPDEFFSELLKIYGEPDLGKQIIECHVWLLSNPEKKPKSVNGCRRRLGNWLKNAEKFGKLTGGAVSTGRAGPTAEETRELIDDIEVGEHRWESLSPEEQEAEALEAKRVFAEWDERHKKPAQTGG